MVTLAQLRCFLAVVGEMNYRRAAERLNMTQPPLTRQIQALEHAVGAALFDRRARAIRLTPAGAAFARSARRILAQTGDAVLDAQRIAAGDTGSLTVAFTAASSYVFLPRFVALLRKAMPEVSLTLREMSSPQQLLALRDEQIDMGLSRPPIIQPGVASMRVYREPLCAVLPDAHPLAGREAIALQDLAGENFITYPPVEGVYFHGLITGLLQAMGVTVAETQHITQTHSILALVGAGLGVALVPRSAERVRFADVVFKPLIGVDEVTADLLLAWRTQNDNPACATAVRHVTEALRDPAWLT
ncbi:HTH-type transcriptional regulator CatM [Pandoraea terrae]|uniref:HTH-type transcriptional regulator CatM n=1 Tax=Pandoraea terrae TaxID=1537710 RepID=A0A5E4YN22_9BURK|nr:LysR family transcriptional regulator [Pandoraea terrae]VVE50209.1 HTH-type transcriptional regulator CatM [Pandoraea terrae]